MVPDGLTYGRNGRTDDAKTISLRLRRGIKKSYFSTKTYVVGTQKNRLNETVLLSDKEMLKLMGKKIFAILRSKILFI